MKRTEVDRSRESRSAQCALIRRAAQGGALREADEWNMSECRWRERPGGLAALIAELVRLMESILGAPLECPRLALAHLIDEHAIQVEWDCADDEVTKGDDDARARSLLTSWEEDVPGKNDDKEGESIAWCLDAFERGRP